MAEPGRSARRAALAMMVAALVAALLTSLQPVRSPDVWHHIKSGWLVTQQGPAHTDPFSCTAQGQPWIQYEWLAQLGIYGVWTAGGVAGLMLMQIGMIGLTAFLLLWAARERVLEVVGAQRLSAEALAKADALPLQTAGAAAAALAVALALCAASDRIFTRPELFSWAILAAWLLALEKLRQGRLRWMILFPILMALWVNLHGAWPAGLALIGLVCGAETSLLLLRRPCATERRTLAALWAAFGLALIATLANPYGALIWEVPFKLAQSPEVRASILEWQRPDWSDWLDLRNVGMVALLTGLVLAPRALKLRDWFVLLFFGALALTARRHIAVAMLVVTPLLAALLAAAWTALGKSTTEGTEDTENGKSEIANRKSVIANHPFLRLRGEHPALAAVIVAVACALLVLLALGFRLERAGVELKKRVYPIAAADFLARNRLDGNLFNSYSYGNYLLFARYPENHVFIDGRVDMYGSRVTKLYDAVRLAGPVWREILAQHGITLCVLEISRTTDEKLLRALSLDPAWALVFWDADSAIFVQRVPEREEFLRGARVWSFLPSLFNPESLRSREELLRAESEFRAKLAVEPECVPALYALARAEGALGRADEEHALLQEALALDPANPVLHYEMGNLLMEKEALPEAAAAFRRAISLGGQPGATRAPVGSAYLALSVIRHRQGDLPGAIREARAALTFAPDNWRIHWNLSVLHEEAGRIPEAIAEVQQVLKLQPKMPDAAARLAALRARAGRGATP